MASITPLSELREKIDAIDQQILQLINQRASCAMEVARTKIAQGEQGSFYRPDRESLVLRRIKDLNQGPLSDRYGGAFFQGIDVSVFGVGKTSGCGLFRPGRHIYPASGIQAFRLMRLKLFRLQPLMIFLMRWKAATANLALCRSKTLPKA